jgi:hypothetical protein
MLTHVNKHNHIFEILLQKDELKPLNSVKQGHYLIYKKIISNLNL